MKEKLLVHLKIISPLEVHLKTSFILLQIAFGSYIVIHRRTLSNALSFILCAQNVYLDIYLLSCFFYFFFIFYIRANIFFIFFSFFSFFLYIVKSSIGTKTEAHLGSANCLNSYLFLL